MDKDEQNIMICQWGADQLFAKPKAQWGRKLICKTLTNKNILHIPSSITMFYHQVRILTMYVNHSPTAQKAICYFWDHGYNYTCRLLFVGSYCICWSCGWLSTIEKEEKKMYPITTKLLSPSLPSQIISTLTLASCMYT